LTLSGRSRAGLHAVRAGRRRTDLLRCCDLKADGSSARQHTGLIEHLLQPGLLALQQLQCLRPFCRDGDMGSARNSLINTYLHLPEFGRLQVNSHALLAIGLLQNSDERRSNLIGGCSRPRAVSP
jgi:hypothetical protein